MGGPGGYDREAGTRATSEEQFDYNIRSSHSPSRPRRTTVLEIDPIVDPQGATRECRDLVGCDPTVPIVFANDLTLTRGRDLEDVDKKLPMFIGQIVKCGVLPGCRPIVSLCGIGDATIDRIPLQVGQFEAGNELDVVLRSIKVEGGGGGTGKESYELAAHFYARRSLHDHYEKRGKRGYFMFSGDEAYYPFVKASEVARIIGDQIPEDISSQLIFSELQRLYHQFFIYPKKTWKKRKEGIDAEIRRRLELAGGKYKDVDIRFTLIWHTYDDLDLHVICPSGEEIFYGHKESRCKGELDVDRNAGRQETREPIENIRWAKGTAPAGEYIVFVRNFDYHESRRAPIPFRVEVEVNGVISHFDGVISPNKETGSSSDVIVHSVMYDPAQMIIAGQDDAYAAYDDGAIIGAWANVMPQENILIINNPKAIIDVMMGAIAMTEGSFNLDQYVVHMRGREQTEERIEDVRNALMPLSNASGAVKIFDVGTRTTGGVSRKSRGRRLN